MSQRSLVIRGVALLAGVLGALVAVPLVGWLGAVFGFVIGFLVGAVLLAIHFVLRARGSAEREAAMHAAAMAQLRSMGALGPMRLAAPPPQRSPGELGRSIREIEVLAATDPAGAIEAAERLRGDFPRSGVLLARLSVLYLAEGRERDAVSTACDAIELALAVGAGPLATSVWDDFADRTDELTLDGTTLDALGRAFRYQGRPEEARTCFARASAGQTA